MIKLSNGAEGEYVSKKYKDNKTNRKLDRVGQSYQKFVIRKGATVLPKGGRKKKGRGIDQELANASPQVRALYESKVNKVFDRVREAGRRGITAMPNPFAVQANALAEARREVNGGALPIRDILNRLPELMKTGLITDLKGSGMRRKC